MKQEPAVGWSISPTYGPVYLLQENFSAGLRSKGHLGNDGHYFVTQQKITVAYTNQMLALAEGLQRRPSGQRTACNYHVAGPSTSRGGGL